MIDLKVRARTKESEANPFKGEIASILALGLALAGVSHAILMQVFL